VSLGAASDRLSPLVGGAWGIGSATDYAKPGDTAPLPRPAPRRRPSGKRNDSAQSDDFETADAFEIGGSGGEATSGSPYGGEGNGQPLEPTGRQAPARRRRPKIEYVGDPEPDELWGHGVVVQRFKLPVGIPQRVSADVAVALNSDGGLEMDPPTGAEMPGLVGWQDPQGEVHTTPTYVIEGGDGGVWKAVVKPAADTMTDIVLYTEAVA
jgi:hypothetical protein